MGLNCSLVLLFDFGVRYFFQIILASFVPGLSTILTIRCESTKEKRAKNLLAIKMQGTSGGGEGGEEPATYVTPDLSYD